MLLNQNSDVIKRNSELVKGYLEIEGLLGKVTKDTVHITTTKTLNQIDRQIVSNILDTGEVVHAMVYNPEVKIKSQDIKKKIEVKEGNQSKVFNQIQVIINNSKK